MRWDRLFEDVEASAADAVADERDALAEELGAEAWAELSWGDLLSGEVVLIVQGVGEVRGEVGWSSSDLVVLSGGAQDLIVARVAVMSAITSGRGGGRLRRIGWSSIFRSVAEEAQEVQLVRRDGGIVFGRVAAVLADAVVLAEQGRRTVIPWTALAMVRPH